MNTGPLRAAAAAFAGAALCALLNAQPLPPAPAGVQTGTFAGMEFSLVASPGNAPYQAGEPGNLGPALGAVPHAYWISRTELTAANYVAFVNAFAPHWTGSTGDWGFTSGYIHRDTAGTYHVIPGFEHSPVNVLLGTAMRYCNWLSNGAPATSTSDAPFSQGAYNLTGISPSAPAWAYSNVTQNASAPYRLPSVDEWIKAVYFDADRYGPGAPGYWDYPHRSDAPPISGYPDQGGETSAGGGVEFEVNRSYPVGWYPQVQSPWGLFDGSGSATEFTSTPVDGGGFYTGGTPIFGGPVALFDHIDLTRDTVFGTGWAGIRLVHVPAPSGLCPLALASFVVLRTHQKESHREVCSNRRRISRVRARR